MDQLLQRTSYEPHGIFSTLSDVGVCVTHAFDDGDGNWLPVVKPGRYLCVRGMHRLHGMTEDFETFEITGVEGHTRVLFHWGNFNEDSEGCECTGEAIAEGVHNGIHEHMVTNSKQTFAKFMALHEGEDSFYLDVEG